MKVFDFSPEQYSNEYQAKGFVNISNGMNPEFLAYARDQAHELIEAQRSLKEWEFKGKKQQFLFSFPPDSDFPHGVKQAVARVAGLSEERMTLCERHIKAYDHTAAANPPPHKDRVASEVAVGIPLAVPHGSYMVLYPNHHVAANPYNTTALLRSSLDENELPENILKDIEPVKLDVQPGDVVMFRGSAIWHERINPANTMLLYLKFNAMRLDPIGEDPGTPLQREKSLGLLRTTPDEQLLRSRIEVSPRLERISRHYTRLYWKEMVQAYIGGEKEFTLSEFDLQIFRNVEGDQTVSGTLECVGVSGADQLNYLPRVRRLIALGGIDILS
ncbi:MAG: hypothetical protein WA970_22690 [Gammaproteobacteria bacterium]